MYLSRLTLNHSRMAILWVSNPYRVHQRLLIAGGGDQRLLFRTEEGPDSQTQILVQTHFLPDWERAFADFPVLLKRVECKEFELKLQPGRFYRFRLLANPTVKKTVERNGEQKKTRLGLVSEDSQTAWLKRKFESAGGEIIACRIIPRGLQHSHKNPAKQENQQTHLAVLFEGVILTREPARLRQSLEAGIGSAKGFGFGLLSLAPVR